MDTPPSTSAGLSRKGQVLAFIKSYLLEHGKGPLVREMADALGVSDSRIKALVAQLARARMIEVQAGVHRGIAIPGLVVDLAIERLRQHGWIVNPDAQMLTPPCPREHLPLIAALDHIPDIEDEGKAA